MQRLLSILFFLFLCFPSMAQTDSNVQYIFLPPVFETVSEKVMVKPARLEWESIGIDRNCFSIEGCKMWYLNEIPAEYVTVSHKILKEKPKKLLYHPPVFETIRDSVMVKPSRLEWKGVHFSKVQPQIRSIHCGEWGGCKVWDLVEVSAEYQIITHQILKSPAYFEDPLMPIEEDKTEVFEESPIAEKMSFKKTIEAENSHKLLQFYPNPANDFVRIEVQSPVEELFVTDFTGKTLLHFTQLNEILSFSVNTFPSGVYFLRYLDGNFWKSERLVVVR